MIPVASGVEEAGWWLQRLGVLEIRSEALREELEAQQQALARSRRVARLHCEAREQHQAQASIYAVEEAEALRQLQTEQAAVEHMRRVNAELDADKGKILREIDDANLELGTTLVAAIKSARAEAGSACAQRGMARRERAMRKALQRKGDVLSELAAKEADQREQRRKLRETAREQLRLREEEARAIERRLAAAEEEIDERRQKEQRSKEAEQRAQKEAEELRAAVQKCDDYLVPRCKVEGQELKRQIRALAEIDVRLHENRKELQEKLWQKEQKHAQKAQNGSAKPWHVWAEVGSQPRGVSSSQ